MNFFKKILVPVDFSSLSHAGVQKAIEIALECQAKELHLLSVVDNTTMGSFITMDTWAYMDTEMVPNQIKESERKLAQLVATLDISTVEISTEVREGNFIKEFIQYTTQHAIELVVMATSARSGFREFIFGNNAHTITTKALCPVLTFHHFAYPHQIKKMIMPVEEFYPLNKLHYAIMLSIFFNAEIHLVCLRQKLHSPLKNTFSVLLRLTEKMDIMGITYKIYVSDGKNITDAIILYAEKEHIDLILVNPGLESQLTGKPIESLGGQIINHTEIPVLTIQKNSQEL